MLWMCRCGVSELPAAYLTLAQESSFIARHVAALSMRAALQPLSDLAALGVCHVGAHAQISGDVCKFEWSAPAE